MADQTWATALQHCAGDGITGTNPKHLIMQISTQMLALNLHELLDSEPNIFRTMRGRSIDFSDTFGLRYNISCRILNGQSRPSRAVLARIALYFKLRDEDLLANA